MSFYKKLEKQEDIFVASNSNMSKRIIKGRDFLNKKIQYFSCDKDFIYIDREDYTNFVGIKKMEYALDKQRYMFTEDE